MAQTFKGKYDFRSSRAEASQAIGSRRRDHEPMTFGNNRHCSWRKPHTTATRRIRPRKNSAWRNLRYATTQPPAPATSPDLLGAVIQRQREARMADKLNIALMLPRTESRGRHQGLAQSTTVASNTKLCLSSIISENIVKYID